MFRSLFIGLLILSALTSKGAGIQLYQNIELSADMLLQLYNAAVQADRLNEPAFALPENAACTDSHNGGPAFAALIRQPKTDLHIAWLMPPVSENGMFLSCTQLELRAERFSCSEIYSRGSDSSPPC